MRSVAAARRLPPLALAAWLVASLCGVAAAQEGEAVERLRFEAEQLEGNGDLEGALQKYALLVEQFPEAPAAAEALLRQVVGYRDLDRTEEAEEAAETLIRTHPRALQAAGAYAHLGQMLADEADGPEELDEARVTLENALLLFPRAAYPKQPWRAEAAVRGARVALRLGRDAEAARVLADVVDLEPRSRWTAEARFELAGLLLDQGDWQEAAAMLQEIVDQTGETDEERALAELARGRLALAHRLGLRPAVDEARWQRARLVGGAPERPIAVVARPDGSLAVTGARDSTVVLDAAGAVVARWSHEDGRRNAWRGELLVVATEEAAATFPDRRNLRFASPPSEKKPTIRPLVAVEPAAFGRWLVLADKPERVMLYEPERRKHDSLVSGKGREPVDLASDRRGRLLVLDRRERTVTRFAADGSGRERLLSGGWDRAEALAVDETGNLYVLDRGERRIEVFDRGGERLTSLGPSLPGGTELERPEDLTVDGAGRLWIADSKLGLIVLE